jgi:hypothetical protein
VVTGFGKTSAIPDDVSDLLAVTAGQKIVNVAETHRSPYRFPERGTTTGLLEVKL